MCSKTSDIYIASCVETGGIYHYKVSDSEYQLVDITRMDRPMYMMIENHKMYIVLRAPFEKHVGSEKQESGVIVYDIDENGKLTNPSEIMSTHGEVACHIAIHEGQIYCANYISGSVIRLPDKLVQHEGNGIHPTRQEGPHAHYVGAAPDGKYICVADLGLDTIFVYRLDLTLYSKTRVPSGHGVRHLAFSEDGKYLYAVNELQSTVAVFSYYEGRLEFIDMCSALPQECGNESIAAAIRIKDGYIYVSNRGHDSIAVLSFDNEKLRIVRHISCGGRHPRDFVLSGEDIFCANQESDCVTVLDGTNNYEIKAHLQIEQPVCICIKTASKGDE